MDRFLAKFKEAVTKIAHVLPKESWISLGVLLTLLLLAVSAFTEISDVVSEHEASGFDAAILHGFHAFSSPFLDVLVSILTEFGGLIGVLTLTLGAVALLSVHRKWRKAAFLAVAVGGAGLLNLALKALFQRTRPDLWEHIVTELSYSFPSGHAMASMALGLSVVMVAWSTRYRWYALGGAIVFVLIIAMTRLYLGVHFPTDIIAGWCASIAWVLLVKFVFSYRQIFQFQKKGDSTKSTPL